MISIPKTIDILRNNRSDGLPQVQQLRGEGIRLRLPVGPSRLHPANR
jgi:hypothetical protein